MLVLISALLLGLMGSFHCAGMCGPIAIALPLHGNRLPQKIYGGVLYNLGRTLTYGLMGAVFGLLGQGVRMIGFQQKVSIIMGAIMIISVFFPSLFKYQYSTENLPSPGCLPSGPFPACFSLDWPMVCYPVDWYTSLLPGPSEQAKWFMDPCICLCLGWVLFR